MIQPRDFFDALLSHRMNFFTGVPDSLLANFCAYIAKNCEGTNDATTQHILAANEGNAVALASGYHIASGDYGVVYLQNSGLGNMINPLLSLADKDVYQIPMLLLIGWRGEPGVKDEPQHITQGRLTLPLLDTLEIPYFVLEQDFMPQLVACANHLQQQKTPVALVVKSNLFAPYPFEPSQSNLPCKRERALELVLENLPDDCLVVSTTGKTSRELFFLRERLTGSHTKDFLTVGSMGHTASIALGMALGSDKPVVCLDGDGSLLMHLGGLAIAGQTRRKNFKYILLNNGAHESVGGQPTVGFSVDFPAICKGFGFPNVFCGQTESEMILATKQLLATEHSVAIFEVAQGSRKDLGRPTTTPVENKIALQQQFAKYHRKERIN